HGRGVSSTAFAGIAMNGAFSNDALKKSRTWLTDCGESRLRRSPTNCCETSQFQQAAPRRSLLVRRRSIVRRWSTASPLRLLAHPKHRTLQAVLELGAAGRQVRVLAANDQRLTGAVSDHEYRGVSGEIGCGFQDANTRHQHGAAATVDLHGFQQIVG